MLLRAEPPPMSVSAGSTSDTFVTPGPSNNLMENNYGAAGAMEVSGTSLGKGVAQAVVQFDLAAAKSSLDQAYGVNGWKIDGVKIQLSGSNPNNPIFNSLLKAGLIQVQWTPVDDWIEGTGNPMNVAAASRRLARSPGVMLRRASPPSTVTAVSGGASVISAAAVARCVECRIYAASPPSQENCSFCSMQHRKTNNFPLPDNTVEGIHS